MDNASFLKKNTVRIECETPGGVSVGTGFWFMFISDETPERYAHLLVTNKHVVSDGVSIKVRVNTGNKPGEQLSCVDLLIENLKEEVILHPSDDVDLCVIPVDCSLQKLHEQYSSLEISFLSNKNLLVPENISSIEDVYMTGYPSGLWDEKNNLPITRAGITASSFYDDWNGKTEFMIDMACFPGSSGSPVCIMNTGSYSTSGGLHIGNRLYFLGVLYGGPMFQVNGSVDIINIPTTTPLISRTQQVMNLGLVIKAERLNDFKPLLGLS